LETARSGEWAIGVDVDQYYTLFDGGAVAGADRLLSSVMKKADNAVFATISDVVASTFSSGTKMYLLKTGGVGLSPFHDAEPYIPQSVRDQLATIEQGIINGTINVRDCTGFCYSFLPLTLRSDN
jgi:basic membrane lipoprotein Med (substrate-binding protein (PBP1-ABC) superfamily)